MDSDALDRWITGGRYSKVELEVWCTNPECETYADMPILVFAESEYGTTWWNPDECPVCGAELSEDRPETGPTCPECEQAEMHEDDHVWICPNCGYETTEPEGEDE